MARLLCGLFDVILLTLAVFSNGKNLEFAKNMTIQQEKRIIGGEYSQQGQWPWIANIYVASGNVCSKSGHQAGQGHVCGGTLISNQWVITASHCYELFKNCRTGQLLSSSDYVIVLGNHHLHQREQEETTNRISTIRYLSFQKADIALIKLERPVSFTSSIQPLRLVSESSPSYTDQKSICTVAGWGVVSNNGHPTQVLKHVNLRMVPWNECLRKIPVELFRWAICAESPSGMQSSCSGDSGGPLMCRAPDGKLELVGIVSYGSSMCANGRPSAYTNVRLLLPWIRSQMNE